MYSETYFGFGEDKTPMQKARIHKTLDKVISFENKITTTKEWVMDRLMGGYAPDKEKEYTKYSTRIEGYTKPKTLYKMQMDSSYFEVTKTEYDYAIYLIGKGLMNKDKAEGYVAEEKEELRIKEEEEDRVREEEKQKSLREQEEYKRERDERQEKRLAEYKKIGEGLITDGIKEIITSAIVEVLMEHNETEESIEENKRRGLGIYTTHLGNKHYIESRVKYLYGGECTNMGNLNNKLEYIIYGNIYGLEKGDLPITLTSKIKAFYEGRVYKGSQKKK